MQRLFTTFPSGPPGFGLLLLRAAIASALADHGAACLFDLTASSGVRVIGAVAAVAAVLLALGLLTPPSGAAAAVIAAGLGLSVLPSPLRNVFGAGATAFTAALAAAALALLGPGAFSVDAALFGRREITIPPHADETP